jgi:hypothetical protein
VPIAQSQRFCDKLLQSSVACEIYTVEGGSHGIRRWESARLTDYKVNMIQWLQRTLSGG